MDGTNLESLLLSIATDPLWLGIGIIIATFILEDAATISAALLAADNLLPVPWALSCLFLGIVLGDLGLYGLGYAANRFKWAQRFLEMDRVTRARDWMHERVVPAVISARFIPGMRLPTYTACGFFSLSFRHFVLAAIVATAVWTAILFGLLYSFGEHILDSFGPWRWAAAPVLILAVITIPRLIQHFRPKAT